MTNDETKEVQSTFEEFIDDEDEDFDENIEIEMMDGSEVPWERMDE